MTDVITDRFSANDSFASAPLPAGTAATGEAIEGEVLAKRYQIRSLLSSGGFGVTFLARNVYLPGQPLCIVKKLAPIATEPKLIERAYKQFDLEALSLSRLGTHAQVPCLLDYFRLGTEVYLIQEYIPGLVLNQAVGKQGAFPEVAVEQFLTQMLHLLEYIHSHQLIHRDIKPENIILCQTDRRFVLLDFGAVEDIDPARSTRQNAARSAIGTPRFAPPEQLAGRAVYASDLYALGMTCIYLLTGREPSHFETDPRTCELMWAQQIDVSEGLREIINKTIELSLADRYHSATQVLTALENRATRAKLRTYLDQKYAVSHATRVGSSSYPAVVHWALGIDR
ncbi:serine/threonine-protein kinase [Chamaesiphon sp. VAR_69_metabat_338]|uniref:serine/threonine-protein kinase n=1 Tax=Chamaesiphon sp. VAR_69_metabat_338 TaxID=2964704 RepID=UPI00286DE429|nr:serine/threonine-protein kinase [Chamaesiphon sp. VAR_69_metabat_338]